MYVQLERPWSCSKRPVVIDIITLVWIIGLAAYRTRCHCPCRTLRAVHKVHTRRRRPARLHSPRQRRHLVVEIFRLRFKWHSHLPLMICIGLKLMQVGQIWIMSTWSFVEDRQLNWSIDVILLIIFEKLWMKLRVASNHFFNDYCLSFQPQYKYWSIKNVFAFMEQVKRNLRQVNKNLEIDLERFFGNLRVCQKK